MDKEQEQRPLHQQPPPEVDLPPSMSRRPTAHRTHSSASLLSPDMRSPLVISDPLSSQSSWDVEALGSPPRKAAADAPRATRPLLSRSFSGRLLSRSNSASSRRAARTPDLRGTTVLSRSNSVSSTRESSLRAVRTPDLYNGESEESESWPGTPHTCRSPTPGLPASLPAPSPPVSASGEGDDASRKSGESCRYREDPEVKAEREQFKYQRGNIYHHRVKEIPYMQSYSDMAFQNDISTHELLRKLMPEDSPTFYEYCGQVPTEVLDIGCGRGIWAAETATMWKQKNCHVTAFDIVDLGRTVRQSLDPEIAAHVLWVQGDFLKPLPFPSSSFGLVRIACLSLAVPMEAWSHLLQEVRRVLKPGGRLELIDDEIFFPEAQFPLGMPQRKDSSRMKPTRTLSADDDSDIEEQKLSRPSIHRSPTAFAGGQTFTRDSPPNSIRKQDIDDFDINALAVFNMETVFKSMLLSKYNIFHRPHEFFETLMTSVFGHGRATCMFRAEIAVPTSDAFLDKGKGKSVLGPSRFASRPPNSANSGRRSLENEDAYSRSSATVAPKAMRVLGGAGSGTPRSPAPPYQPPGFIVLPSTFVPCEPDALEMYACKNMHTLLACKHALASYVQEQTDEDGQPLISDAEFDELSWTYDRFKRTRFNWPETYPGLNLDDDNSLSSATKPLFNRPDGSIFSRRRTVSNVNTVQQTLAIPPRREEVIPIRTIRVYQGFKSGPGVDSVQLIPLPGRLED